MKRPHGSPPRGMATHPSSPAFEGTYGRIFRALPAAKFSDDALKALAKKMVADKEDTQTPETEVDPEENQGIDAGYTYFGQFIDHDLTFDPASSLQKLDDPNGLIDYRTPRFDLDNLYGRGPDDQPYMYEGNKFILGPTLSGNDKDAGARGLPRNNSDPKRAIIGDPRNDENVIVSQLQATFLRFHNFMADQLQAKTKRHVDFAEIQRQVRFHYQYVILNDFLPVIVGESTLNDILPNRNSGKTIHDDPPKLKIYKFENHPFIPVEFSVAAYRFGHSMVRPIYRLNQTIGRKTIFAKNGDDSLNGFREFPNDWAIDWDLFFNPGTTPPLGPERTQKSYKIDTSLVNPLLDLFRDRGAVSSGPGNLAERNLLRGKEFSLPSGQAVAHQLGEIPIEDQLLIVGKATKEDPNVLLVAISDEFIGNAPLWYYVLAEAQQQFDGNDATPIRLGGVGGRIVAETFIGLMLGDPQSLLNQHSKWLPLEILGGKDCKIRNVLNAARDFDKTV